MQDTIEIRSQVKRNVIVSVLIGLVGLSLASITFSVLPKSFYLIGIFLTSASLVALLIAWVKYREPQFSFISIGMGNGSLIGAISSELMCLKSLMD
jgi:hypothetical protein